MVGGLVVKNIGIARIYDKQTDKHLCNNCIYIYDCDNQDILFVKQYKFRRVDPDIYKIEMV